MGKGRKTKERKRRKEKTGDSRQRGDMSVWSIKTQWYPLWNKTLFKDYVKIVWGWPVGLRKNTTVFW